MQQLNRLLTFAFLLLFTANLSAQSTASISTDSKVNLDLINLDNNNWSFYIDEENKLYYIDFEKISFNLSEIRVKDVDGEVLMKEDVLDLPVNTIYELDFSKYNAGEYEVELRSFTGVLRKKVNIQ